MSDKTMRITGGCVCGAVRYEAVGEPFWVGHCHCNSCRRHSGAPVTTYVGFRQAQVRFTKGERRIYNSSGRGAGLLRPLRHDLDLGRGLGGHRAHG